MVQAPQAPENQEQEHFGGLSTGGLALPTAYYVRDVDFSTVEVQRYLEELGAEIVALDGVNQETPVGCNHWVPALRNVEHQTRWSRDCLEFLRVFWCFLQVAKHYSDIFRHIIQKSSVHHVQNMFFPSSPHEEKTPPTRQDRGLKSWHSVFTLWANNHRGTKASLPTGAFVSMETNRTGCTAALPAGVTSCVSLGDAQWCFLFVCIIGFAWLNNVKYCIFPQQLLAAY